MYYFSPFEYSYLVLSLIGFIIGFAGTIVGGGGGVFILPVLTIGFGVDSKVAVLVSLVASLPICLVGAYGYYRKQQVDLRITFIFSAIGAIGIIAGVWFTQQIDSAQVKMFYGFYSLLMATQIIVNTYRKTKKLKQDELTEDTTATKYAKSSFFGFCGGLITGTFGTSGTAPILAGLFSIDLPIKAVIGTSLSIVLINTLVSTGFHMAVGALDLTLVCFLTAGSLIGATLGPRIITKSERVDRSEGKIRYIYGFVFAILGLLMIFK